MKKLKFPFPFGKVYFVGIGGIGMSGIAEIMHLSGYNVSGSDIAENANVIRLRNMGIDVKIGHKAENIEGAGVVVVSSAISENNEEVKAAKSMMIPVIHRSAMLAELMRSHWSISVGGTHGKTTTTSMVSAILKEAGKDPTVVNGGIINASGTNALVGEGDWMVVEADESDGSFTVFPSTIVIVTNIDADHMDYYHDSDAIKKVFCQFVNNVPFYGLACLCIDSPFVQEIIPSVARPVLTYGLNRQADISAFNICAKKGELTFDVAIKNRKTDEVGVIKDFYLPLYGEDNVKNALAAIGVALKLDISVDIIKKALKNFEGVKRRFTKIAEVGGVTLIDDYAHHPVEIAAVLKGARNVTDGKIVAVWQPHRYSRAKALFSGFCTAFNDADAVIVTDIYPAGEKSIEGINKEYMANGITTCGHRDVTVASSFDDVPALIASKVKQGDFVIFLGAGSISSAAYKMVDKLKELM